MKPPLSYLPALPAAIGLIIGIALAGMGLSILAIAAGLSIGVWGLFRRKHLVGYMGIMAAIGGILWIVHDADTIDKSELNKLCAIQGAIAEAEEKDYGYNLVIRLSDINGNPAAATKCYLQVHEFLPTRLHAGDKISLKGFLNKISPEPEIPGDAYHPQWLLSQGIPYTLRYQTGSLKVEQEAAGFDRMVNSIRDTMHDAIVRSPISGGAAAFLVAAILGDDLYLSPGLLQDFRASGISHLLALSGMHVAILMSLLAFALMPLRMLRSGFYITNAAVILFAWIYAIITGLPTSVVRAVTMVSVVLLANLLQRGAHPINSLSIAAIVILAFAPYQLFTPGFQLSFCAVITIIIFWKLLPKEIRRHKLLYYIITLTLMPVAAMLGTGLISAYHFNIFPPLFLCANMVVGIIFPYLLAGGFIVMILTLAHLPASWIGSIVDFLYDCLNGSANWFSSLFHAINVPAFSALAFLPYALALAFLAISLHKMTQKQPWQQSMAISLCALIMTGVMMSFTPASSPAPAIYMPSGSAACMLICQDGSAHLLSLHKNGDQADLLIQANRRYGNTAIMHGGKEIKPLPADTLLKSCQYSRSHLVAADKVVRIVHENQLETSPCQVDYAVIGSRYTGDIGTVVAACHPDTVLLMGDIAPSRRKRLKKECGDTVPCIDLHIQSVIIPIISSF